MTKVICIVGLPGSGKTNLANLLASGRPDVCVVDDITSLDQLPEPGLFEVVIITDPNFCITDVRVLAASKLVERYNNAVSYVFFENDPEKAIRNVVRRNDGRPVFQSIRMLSKVYRIPEDVTIMPIWDGS